MSLNSTQWGVLTKLLYRFFRPHLLKMVRSTDNDLDDTALKVADKLAGK